MVHEPPDCDQPPEPPPPPPAAAIMVERAATAASSPLRLAWEQHLPLLSRHLHDQADRWALRLVCREWRTAVDHVSCPGHCC